MKTLISITSLLALTVALHAQSSEKRNLGTFTGIDIRDAGSVNLIQSDTDDITINSKGDLKLITTKVDDGILKIRSNSGVTCDVRIHDLKSISAHDAAVVKSQNTLKVSALNIKESDASNINLDIDGGSVTAVAKDASVLKLTGTASKLDALSSDGSSIKTTELKADTVTASASDGGVIKTWAVNKITAKATDGGVINFKGTPALKNTSADDGGAIKSDDGSTIIKEGDTDESDKDDSTTSSGGMDHSMQDGYIGFGYVAGPEHAGARVMYGRSREFNFGFGNGYKFCKWNGIGYNVYYKSTDFFLEPDADKVLPSPVIHNAEKIAFNNIGGLVFDRFYFGKFFLDGGFYYDWIFWNRHVTWDNYPNGDNASSSSTKTIDRNLSFIKSTDYGVQFKLGTKNGVALYFNYRLSNLFKPVSGSATGLPELPPYVLGINFGIF
jgi:hypothetical protein